MGVEFWIALFFAGLIVLMFGGFIAIKKNSKLWARLTILLMMLWSAINCFIFISKKEEWFLLFVMMFGLLSILSFTYLVICAFSSEAKEAGKELRETE